MSNEELKKNSILQSINHIEELLDQHDDSKPYKDSDINEILTDLEDVRHNLSELQGKYQKMAEDSNKFDYRLKAVEDKIDTMNRQDELKHQRELKYIDYAVCSAIGSLVGYYISKLTRGH